MTHLFKAGDWISLAKQKENSANSFFTKWLRRDHQIELLEDAADAYQKAANDYLNHKDLVSAANVLVQSADLHLRVVDLEPSLTTFTAARLYSTAAHYFYQSQNYELFVENMHKSIKYYLLCGNFSDAAQLHQRLGKFYCSQDPKLLDKALVEYQTAAELIQSDQHGQFKYQTYLLQIAELYAMLEQYDLAISTYNRLQNIDNSSNDCRKAAEYWFRIGLCHLANNDLVAVGRWVGQWPENMIGPILKHREGRVMMELIQAVSDHNVEQCTTIIDTYLQSPINKSWTTAIMSRIKEKLETCHIFNDACSCPRLNMDGDNDDDDGNLC